MRKFKSGELLVLTNQAESMGSVSVNMNSGMINDVRPGDIVLVVRRGYPRSRDGEWCQPEETVTVFSSRHHMLGWFYNDEVTRV